MPRAPKLEQRHRRLPGLTVWHRTAVCLILVGPLLASCSSLIGSMAAQTLSATILNQDDPQLLKSGAPAYLLLVDGLIYQRPDNANVLAAGAQLFALYGSRFADDASRAAVLTAKARRYGERAICLTHSPACAWAGLPYDRFVAELDEVGRKRVGALYAFAVSWLSHLDATSEDWTAVAELPWVEAALERALALDESYERGAIHGYLGILNTLRPPALGGRPEVAREHFERALELSGNRDLSIKVEYARRYARLIFDQELHDRLLNEVLNASVDAPGLTLFNVLAQQQARELLASSKEYF
ncbi:MAG TPA: TRAP transporter TatT component family protein [Gammaproteobacteria bacterium]|nr:TRAP transporter TatT component family protein [Gammaproteobacteria bacterium]